MGGLGLLGFRGFGVIGVIGVMGLGVLGLKGFTRFRVWGLRFRLPRAPKGSEDGRFGALKGSF